MADIFDNTILCKHCDSRMQKAQIAKNGFLLRAVVCGKCGDKIIHPADETEYGRFTALRNKEFHVKMRLVGNSYTVSIPKEIASFIREQERMMNDMVKLCFEDFGRLSLNFGNFGNGNGEEVKGGRVIRAREVRMVKNGKPVLHSKEFSDSANPEKNLKAYKLDDQE